MAAHGSSQSFKILHRPPLQLHSFVFQFAAKLRFDRVGNPRAIERVVMEVRRDIANACNARADEAGEPQLEEQ